MPRVPPPLCAVLLLAGCNEAPQQDVPTAPPPIRASSAATAGAAASTLATGAPAQPTGRSYGRGQGGPKLGVGDGQAAVTGMEGARQGAVPMGATVIPTMNVFKKSHYGRALMFAFNAGEWRPDGKSCESAYENGRLCSRGQPQGKPISRAHGDAILNLLKQNALFGGMRAKCYMPRHSVAFFDPQNHVVGEVAVCFECNGGAVHAPGSTEPPLQGFSLKGRALLHGICTELGLEHCGNLKL